MEIDDFSIFNKFYQLSDIDKKGAIHLQPSGNALDFPYLDILKICANERISVSFTIKKGSKWTDLIYAGWPSTYVVSARFYHALKGITGLNLYPTVIIDPKTNERDDSHFSLSVMGQSGPIVKEWYKEEEVSLPGGIYTIRKGVYFDLDSWDGSDFFVPVNTSMIVVTEKIKMIIEQQKLTNVCFTRLADLENHQL